MAAPPYRVERKHTMTINEIMNAITTAFPQVDFIQIDNNEFVYAGEVVDGVQQYHSIKFGTKATKDTKTHKAFNLDTAIEKYDEKKSKAAERAAKPKTTRVKEVTPEQAALVADVREVLSSQASGMNAQEIAEVINTNRDEPVTWQKVSSILKKFATDGICTTDERDGKRVYALAE